MPTTDFFSGPGFEPEDVPVKKTSPAQQPVEKQPADDEPFAGMQKLDFDFLGGDDPAVPGETDPGDPFDDFSFQRPAAPAGPAQPARPAPFVFDEEPAPAPFSGVPETRITPAASASLGGTDDAPVRPVSPAQAAPKAAPFVFDFDDAPVERPASRTAASAAPSGEAVFDFGILEEKPAPAVPPASGGEELRPSGWPAATPRPANAPRTPRPINWHAPVSPAQRPAPAPARPAPPPAQAPQPPAAETPLDFDFEGAQPFDLFDDVPQSGYTAPQETDQAFPDLYDRDPEEAEPAPRAPQRRTRTGGGSGSGGGRPPRRSTGTARRGIPNKTIFAWAGIVLIALLIILYFVFFGGKDGDVAPGTSGSVPSSTSQPADSTPPDASSAAPVETIPRDEWYMVLANRSSVLPGDFTVAETATVGEAVVDARIAEALRQMVNDAAAAGVKLKPTNGYRSIARQQELWDARVKTLMEGGLSQADAETKAIDYTSAPGTSDHNTGLGLDIVSEDHPAKDAGFAETAAAQWLAEHAADYGFILRYPSDKTEATGMDYEPWHYRYVGSEQAHKIKESGLCLEEYLAQ